MDLCVAPGVSWQVTRRGVRLFRDGETELLGYPKAILWDLIARGRPLTEAFAVFAPSAALAPETARIRIAAILGHLEQAGWLAPGEPAP